MKRTIVMTFEASTSHITENDNKLLRSNDSPVSSYGYEYGDFVYVPTIAEKGADQGMLKFGYSQAFVNLLVLANEAGCRFLQLDCDGTVYSDLPQFSW